MKFSLPQDDLDYIERRAEPFRGNRSAALRKIIHEAQKLRHDLAGKIGTLDLIERCLTARVATNDDAIGWIRLLRTELTELVDGASG